MEYARKRQAEFHKSAIGTNRTLRRRGSYVSGFVESENDG
jgi:hypothetical protein